MKTVAFHILGCKVNQYETEAMEELFEKSGYNIDSKIYKYDLTFTDVFSFNGVEQCRKKCLVIKA